MDSQKPVHTIILDSGPILRNDPSLDSLLQKSERLMTVPAVISEIKDPGTRSRLEILLIPFIDIKIPHPNSLQIVTDFARKTGDLTVLSKPDIQVLALAYEIECERNGGDWRLRRFPGQRGLNGMPPKKQDTEPAQPQITSLTKSKTQDTGDQISNDTKEIKQPAIPTGPNLTHVEVEHPAASSIQSYSQVALASDLLSAEQSIRHSSQDSARRVVTEAEQPTSSCEGLPEQLASDSSDSDGWITPSNVTKHQARDSNTVMEPVSEHLHIQVATITTDFAMQNVLLQMNLNLLSTSLQRVKKVKTWILRCHACFDKTKDISRQFCNRCGKPTLTRVSCTVDQSGKPTLHLKKNMQWNHRGDRFSIPKPVPGTASGKVGQGKGGGKGGWGQELIFAEDQKEYLRAVDGRSRRKEKNLMDEDYLPGILTGARGWNSGQPKIGGGRNVNSKKR